MAISIVEARAQSFVIFGGPRQVSDIFKDARAAAYEHARRCPLPKEGEDIGAFCDKIAARCAKPAPAITKVLRMEWIDNPDRLQVTNQPQGRYVHPSGIIFLELGFSGCPEFFRAIDPGKFVGPEWKVSQVQKILRVAVHVDSSNSKHYTEKVRTFPTAIEPHLTRMQEASSSEGGSDAAQVRSIMEPVIKERLKARAGFASGRGQQ